MNQILYSLIICIAVGGTAGYLGSLMITKRTALIGDAFGHVALPGIAIALVNGFDPSLGAFIALLCGVILIWLIEMKTTLPVEAITGIVFTASVAIAFLFIPQEQISTALIGDISQVNATATGISVIVCVGLMITLHLIYQKTLLIKMSEHVARTEHINTSLMNFVFLICVAVTVAIGIKVTGSLLIGALVVTPAAIARNYSQNLLQYKGSSFVFGAIFCIIGLVLYTITKVPAGPMTILSASAFFVLSVIFKRQGV